MILKRFLKDSSIKIIGECHDGDEVIPFLQKNEADIIVMDMKMERVGGVEATKMVLQHYPYIKVIGHSLMSKDFGEELIKIGAVVFVKKRQQRNYRGC